MAASGNHLSVVFSGRQADYKGVYPIISKIDKEEIFPRIES